MSTPITAPLLAQALAAQQARPTTPTNRNVLPAEPFVFNLEGARAWLAEHSGKCGTALTPKQMQDWDEKSLLAGGWL